MPQVLTNMTHEVSFAVEADDLALVWHQMQALNVRHIPVTRDGTVVGIVSDRDVFKHGRVKADGTLGIPTIKVREVMSTPVITCRTSDSIGAIVRAMLERKIDALPVTTAEGRLLGIITSSDLLRLLQTREDDLSTLASDWQNALLVARGKCWRPQEA